MRYYFLSALLILGLMTSCQSQSTDTHEEETEEAHEHEHESEEGHAANEISITPEKAEAAGIRSEAIQAGPFQGAILCNGRIQSAWNTQQVLSAPASGIVKLHGALVTGSKVSQGSVLLTISGESMVGGDEGQKAQITLETAQAEYNRISTLYEQHLVTAEEYNQAKEAYLQAQLQAKASGSSSSKGTPLKAGLSGYLVSLDVQEGDYVTAGQRIGLIANSSKMILEADLPGRYKSLLSEVVGANIRPEYDTEYLDGASLGVRLLSTSEALKNGVFPVTFELNYHKDLAIGSYCQAYLLTETRQGVISLPSDAITEEQGVYYAYKQLDEDCYEKVLITTGQSNGERTEVLSGISEGDQIVTAGAIHVKLASASNAIPAHSHHH